MLHLINCVDRVGHDLAGYIVTTNTWVRLNLSAHDLRYVQLFTMQCVLLASIISITSPVSRYTWLVVVFMWVTTLPFLRWTI